MTASLDTATLCGQLLVGGFDGPSLPAEMRTALREGRRGGVILFKRNAPSIDAVHEICQTAVDESADDRPPFIGIDEEGGRVRRLPSPITALPPMRVLGSIGDPELAERAAQALGLQLAALGINLDFAPVLDVDSNPKNPIIGDRAFSSDPDVVARFGRAVVRGLTAAQVLACGKHFPGHGDTSKDSHVDLPFVSSSRERLEGTEFIPFRAACHAHVPTLMTAHVVYDALDRGVPATLSRVVATQILRREFGFQGVLFSDDLEMKALADRHSVEESAVGAIYAGCDVLLICKDMAMQEAAHTALVHEAERSPDFRRRCEEAARRALDARRRFPPRPLPDRSALAQAIAAAGGDAVLAEIEARSG